MFSVSVEAESGNVTMLSVTTRSCVVAARCGATVRTVRGLVRTCMLPARLMFAARTAVSAPTTRCEIWKGTVSSPASVLVSTLAAAMARGPSSTGTATSGKSHNASKGSTGTEWHLCMALDKENNPVLRKKAQLSNPGFFNFSINGVS